MLTQTEQTMLLRCCCIARVYAAVHDINASAVVAGRMALTVHMERRKVLLVIDDIDNQTQLMGLLPPCMLHPESLVVITSRSRKVLSARCTKVIEVQLLPEGRDVELFKAWAFAAGTPAWDTSVLLPKVVACCGRLPLSLKVCTAYAEIRTASRPSCICNLDITLAA